MTTERPETPDEQSAPPMQNIDPIPEPEQDDAYVESFEAVNITKSKEPLAPLMPTAPHPESRQTTTVDEQSKAKSEQGSDASSSSDDDDDEEYDDDDDEPRLNYARMTQNLASVYRNGDATSAFLVAGDKMIVGTHNGNIHVIQLPTFSTLRVYHAHSASVTSISISPFPPPLPSSSSTPRPTSTMKQPDTSPSTPKKSRAAQQIPRIPSNDIYIATASMDGNVCVQSLLDIKDVQLRSFGRPVQCVALSPNYKSDRIYISGGLAGHLVLTVGGQPGRSTSTTTGTASATAAGWLGSVGLAGNAAKDTILHSGEGTVSCVKWSLSGKFVMWLNEHGIKIMRTSLHLESSDSEDAWTRIGHIDRPQTQEWETMASVWKGRAEWIDENSLEIDNLRTTTDEEVAKGVNLTHADDSERLLVGWGETIWIVHVHSSGQRGTRTSGKTAGRAEIVKILRMDCIISGLALYTKSLLLVLAFCNPGEDCEDVQNDQQSARKHRARQSVPIAGSQPSGGIRRRQNNLPPELRLIDLDSQMEIDKYSLPVSRYERLLAGDYQLSILPARSAASAITSRGALETLTGFGVDIWHAATNPKTLFSSGASILSRDSGDDASSKVASSGPIRGTPSNSTSHPIDPSISKPGAKIFIQSPYDCILATKRDLTDHLTWLVDRNEFAKAWEVLDENPDILAFMPEKQHGYTSSISSQPVAKLDELIDDESLAESTKRSILSATEKEKRRIGEFWIQQLVENGEWKAAGVTCGKVISTSDKWEKWVWEFAGANKFDEIVDFIPAIPLTPPIPTTVYEVVLGHYIQSNKVKFGELLDCWSLDLFDTKAVAKALENQLKFRDVREDSIENGERGRDWTIVTEALAKLYEAGGRFREALKAYIKLHDPDNTFRLIKDNHLAEAVSDDIPAFINLRVPDSKLDKMTEAELAVATAEPISVLVDAAQRGLVTPKTIVDQLQGKKMMQYLYFYLRALWAGQGMAEHRMDENNERLLLESKTMVDGFADLAIHLFAKYNRPLLMEMLKASTAYTFEKAVQECETHEYFDELVYLYSKTGQMRRALYLIIDRLHDVQKAIDFAKEQDDPDLWEVLLSYSMDKPKFIRALLEQVGTAINPMNLVERIPAGLEIQGLREGLTHMMKEHELQHSISSGAARVLRSEVAATQNKLRIGQCRGIKFEPSSPLPQPTALGSSKGNEHVSGTRPFEQAGHCAQCGEEFTTFEVEALLGYSCGHVFHISHLLELLGLEETANDDFASRFNDGGRYLVGMKVMKARLLRDRVKIGCPLCKANAT